MNKVLSKYAAGVMALAMLGSTMAASAQLPVPANSQFDVTGVLQAATLGANTFGRAAAFAGGTLTINGQLIIVPDNTVVQYPANNSTWQGMFAQAPSPYGLKNSVANPTTIDKSGMALADSPKPKVTWEVNVIGNRVIDAAGRDRYIAGLITFSQEALNAGQGYINFIDYTKGEMWVGGAMPIGGVGLPGLGIRLQINDPHAVYSKGLSPDARFTADTDNPTIRSVTGYPMGLPNPDGSDPLHINGDALRPEKNRPQDPSYVVADSFDLNGNLIPGNGAAFTTPTIFTMPDPHFVPDPSLGLDPNFAASCPDARLEAPFEVGDYVDYAGTLVDDASGVTPTYISAHTIVANAAIYTAAGVNPAYVAIDVSILGTGGVLVPGLVEAATRTRFEGFTTDPSRTIFLFGKDLNPNFNPADPTSVATVDRDWGSIDIDPGAPTGVAKGRWRFRPPATVLTMPTFGTFGAPTREVRAVLADGYDVPTKTYLHPAWTGQVTGNGIAAGQYSSPIAEYLFPEQTPGAAVPPNNFEAFQWLGLGGQVVPDGVAGPLVPWPGATAPTPPPAPGLVTISAGFGQTVAQGALVNLNGFAYDINGNAYNLAWSPVATAPASVSGTETLASGASPVNLLGATATMPKKNGVVQYQLDVVDANGKKLGISSVVSINVVSVINTVAITGVAQKFTDRRLSITATDSRVPVNATAAVYAKLKPAVLLTATTSGALDSNGFPADQQVNLIFVPASTDPITKIVTPASFVGDVVSSGMNATSVTVTSDTGSFQSDRNIDIAALIAAGILKIKVGLWTEFLLP